MALSGGARLGPYEILSTLGAGGMGEVYRAKDTRLDRVVAVKVLPEHPSSTLQIRERFEREARAISSLSHLQPVSFLRFAKSSQEQRTRCSRGSKVERLIVSVHIYLGSRSIVTISFFRTSRSNHCGSSRDDNCWASKEAANTQSSGTHILLADAG